jgi:hypothetical protein
MVWAASEVSRSGVKVTDEAAAAVRTGVMGGVGVRGVGKGEFEPEGLEIGEFAGTAVCPLHPLIAQTRMKRRKTFLFISFLSTFRMNRGFSGTHALHRIRDQFSSHHVQDQFVFYYSEKAKVYLT